MIKNVRGWKLLHNFFFQTVVNLRCERFIILMILGFKFYFKSEQLIKMERLITSRKASIDVVKMYGNSRPRKEPSCLP